MKTAKTFRLSKEALTHLTSLKERTGSNETAIVEIALAMLNQGMFGGVPARERGVAPNMPEFGEIEAPRRKKRKRRN